MFALTEFSDYPYVIPSGKVDWTKTSPWTGWMDLTLGKKAFATSALMGHGTNMGCDNSIKTWWSACTGDIGEWYGVDLGSEKTVRAVQTNFADQGFGLGPEPKSPYRYLLECSSDGYNWTILKDYSESGTGNPHTLIVLDSAVRTRYIRVRNMAPLTGLMSVFDFRVFGNGDAPRPPAVKSLTAVRSEDPRRITVSWPSSEGADGYVLHWGVRKDEMYSSCQVYGTEVELGLFTKGQEYYFSVDAFSEGGVTKGKKVLKVN